MAQWLRICAPNSGDMVASVARDLKFPMLHSTAQKKKKEEKKGSKTTIANTDMYNFYKQKM